MTQNIKKRNSAKAAFEFIKPNLNKDTVLGIGTGSTTNFFIEQINESNINGSTEPHTDNSLFTSMLYLNDEKDGQKSNMKSTKSQMVKNNEKY